MTTETLLGRDVTLEDGLVVLPAGKNRRVIWVQCPICGPQVPETAWNKPRGTQAILFHHATISLGPDNVVPLICSGCGQDSFYKEILIPKEQKASHEECTNKCLDGKTFCACGCRGRCHSEGCCYCAASTGKGRERCRFYRPTHHQRSSNQFWFG